MCVSSHPILSSRYIACSHVTRYCKSDKGPRSHVGRYKKLDDRSWSLNRRYMKKPFGDHWMHATHALASALVFQFELIIYTHFWPGSLTRRSRGWRRLRRTMHAQCWSKPRYSTLVNTPEATLPITRWPLWLKHWNLVLELSGLISVKFFFFKVCRYPVIISTV